MCNMSFLLIYNFFLLKVDWLNENNYIVHVFSACLFSCDIFLLSIGDSLGVRVT